MNTPTLADELRRAEQRLMKFPMAKRTQLQVQDLRQQLEHQRDLQARALRGQIRKGLMGMDVDTLARIAREMEAVS